MSKIRVLLFSNDLMPFGNLPTSGGGLRCWQLLKGLEAHGVEVIASMPGFTYLAEKYYNDIPLEQREVLWSWGKQDDLVRQLKPDAVLFASNWDHFNLTKSIDAPVIIDLHGSRLIETTMFNQPVNTAHKVEIFSKADCLLSAGKRQRKYFYGWLLQAGRVPEDEHFIRYIPVSLAPERCTHTYPTISDTNAPIFVSGGGWFPWQNQSKAIFAIASAICQRNRGQIDIFGTPHPAQSMSKEQMEIREVYNKIIQFSEKSEQIRVHGYIGRDSLLKLYSKASAAVELMQYNLERELAFTTRTIEYLWCGLPVIYNNYSEISEHILEYDAGWSIDPNDETEIAKVIDDIFFHPELVKRKGENAQRLVEDRFSWDKTIIPLLDFLGSPKKASKAYPAKGEVQVRSSFLSPSGSEVDIQLGNNPKTLTQKFIVPAENIKGVELGFSLCDDVSPNDINGFEISLLNKKDRYVAKRKIQGEELASMNFLAINFPLLKRPNGGKEYILELCYLGAKYNLLKKHNCSLISIKGLLNLQYPLCDNKNTFFDAISPLGERVKAQSLALSFVLAGHRWHRLKSISQRAYWMLKKGEWLSLSKLAARKGINVMHKIKSQYTR